MTRRTFLATTAAASATAAFAQTNATPLLTRGVVLYPFRHITTFATYIDADYAQLHGDPQPVLNAYGKALSA